MPLAVFLPFDEQLGIRQGSGIVGSPVEGFDRQMRMIDYEGNLYGSQNVVTFADRCAIAAGRHLERYPTVARMVVHRNRLVEIGEFDPEFGQVELIEDPRARELLADWLGVEFVVDELRRSS